MSAVEPVHTEDQKAMPVLIVSRRRKRNQPRKSGEELIGEVGRQPTLYYTESRRERLIEATRGQGDYW